MAIAAYLSPWEAHVLRGALEAAGIFAMVIGETDYMGNAGADARVLVREEDLRRALEIKRDALRT